MKMLSLLSSAGIALLTTMVIAATAISAPGLPNEGIIKLISESMTELEKLVNVELHAPLPKESVEAMAALTAKTVVACVKEAK